MDQSLWRSALVQPWLDLIRPDRPVELFVALPRPHQNAHNHLQFAAFVLVVQGRSPQLCPVLHTLFEDGEYTHMAQLIFPQIRLRQLIHTLGLGRRCLGRVPTFRCTILYGDQHVQQEPGMHLSPGASLLISVFPLPPDWQVSYAAQLELTRQLVAGCG